MAWSQTERNGQVLEAVTDMPIPGVNVIIKGTNNGVVTDFDGNYSIMATSQDTLVFSYVGFQNKEILVGNKVTMNVSLEENTEALSEVVVVGYGSQKREDITGAVGVIDAILAEPPVPPVPSLANTTVSPTEYPSPGSNISTALIVASDTDATFAAASAPPPPVIESSSPTE